MGGATSFRRARARRVVFVGVVGALIASLVGAPKASGLLDGHAARNQLPALPAANPAKIEVPKPATSTSPGPGALPPKPKGHLNEGPMTEVVGARTEFTETFVRPDGTRLLKSSMVPLHFRSGGNWRRIDNRLVADERHPGWIENKANSWSIRFGPLHDGVVVQAKDDRVAFAPQDASNVTPRVNEDGTSVTYKDAFGHGVDLTYKVLSDRVEELVVYRTKSDRATFAFRLKSAPLAPDSERPGGLVIGDGTLRIDAPTVISAAGNIVQHADPKLSVGAATDGASVVSVAVDQAWLDSQPASAFPITVDPSISGVSSDSYASYPSDGSAACSCTKVGHVGTTGTLTWRALAHYPFGTAVDRHSRVLDVQIEADAINTVNQYDFSVSYAATPNYNGGDNQTVLDSRLFGSQVFMESTGLTNLYQSFVDSGNKGGAVFFKGREVNTENTLKTFNSYLWMSYDTPPATPIYVGPADGSIIPTTTPTLAVTPVSDADGETTQIEFVVSSDASSVIGCEGNWGWCSGWQSSRSVTLPAGLLDEGVSYTWQAWSQDSEGYVVVAPARTFRVSHRVGDGTTQAKDVRGPVTVDVNSGNLSTSVSTPSVATVAGAAGVSLTYNSLTSQAVTGTFSNKYYVPDGWTLAAGADDVAYASLDVEPNSVIAVAASGDRSEYKKQTSGGFTPPDGSNSVLAANADGSGYTLLDDDGTMYSFDSAGRLTNVTDAVDDRKPAALGYVYNGSPLHLAQITDPGRGGATVVTLLYNRAGDSCPTVPSNAGFTAPPTDFLCGVRLNDGRTTAFFYSGNLLSRVVNLTTDSSTAPDEVLADYGYTTTAPTGLMNTVRDSTGYDYSLSSGVDIPTMRTSITYDSANRVASVGLPTQYGGTGTRPTHTYTYYDGAETGGFFAPAGSSATGGIDVAAGNVNGGVDKIVTGAGPNEDGLVRVYNRDGSVAIGTTINPFPGFNGQLNVASADVDGDGVAEAVVGAGAGGGPNVTVYKWTGSSWTVLANWFAYESGFNGGVDVAAGDVDGDGKAEVITTPGAGRSSDVKVWKIAGGSASLLTQYTPFGGWTGGLRATTLDTDFDGKVEVATSAMPGGGPRVAIWKPLSAQVVWDKFVLDPSFNGGVDVGAWQKGDQLSVTTASLDTFLLTPDDGSYVRAVYGGFQGGAHVAMGDLEGLGVGEAITGANPGGGPHVRVFKPRQVTDTFDPNLSPQPDKKFVGRSVYDGSLRTVETRDPAGLATHTSWRPSQDQVVSVTTPAGIRTSTLYDRHNWPVTNYGPAPATYFALDGSLLSGHSSADVPTSTTAYDEGMSGLAAAFWPNTNLSGAPTAHQLGVGTGDGTVSVSWSSTNKPPGYSDYQNFSMRLTGEIHFSSVGIYQLKATSDDGVRLYIDGQKILDGWSGHPATPFTGNFNNTSDSWHAIRIDYYNGIDVGSLALAETPPGSSERLVSGSELAPEYGLLTSATDADGHLTRTEYASPQFGLATATVRDPNGLNLRSTTDYEPIGTGFMRRQFSTPPRGSASRTKFTYWDDDPNTTGTNERLATNPCAAGNPVVDQGGLLQSEISPAPAVGSAITREYRYDAEGRRVASRVVGDPYWTCTTFDGRGRMRTQTDSANKTSTLTYSPDGLSVTASFPDSDGNTKTTTSYRDLNGPVGYKDELGTTFFSDFDNSLRLIDTKRQFGGGPQTVVQTRAYDYHTTRLSTIVDKTSGADRSTSYTYDAFGRPKDTTRPVVQTTSTYDALTGRLQSISNKQNGTLEQSPWAYAYTLGGRVKTESNSLSGLSRTYTYDNADRLKTTNENGTLRNYAYDADSNRCAMATSCTSPTYQYDNADRLTSSPFASSYQYDNHGNLKSAGMAQPSSGSVNQSFAFDPSGAPTNFGPFAVGQAGTFNASLDWNATGSGYTTGSSTVNAPANGSSPSVPVPMTTNGYVTADLVAPSATAVDYLSDSISAQTSVPKSFNVNAPGAINVNLDWNSSSTSLPAGTAKSVANGGTSDTPITVSANGLINATATWPTGKSGSISLLDPLGNTVAGPVSSALTGGSVSLPTYSVSNLGAYPATAQYRLHLKAASTNVTTASVGLTGTWPVTANLELYLRDPQNNVVASATTSSSKPKVVSWPVPTGDPSKLGSYSISVLSRDYDASFTASAQHQQFANLSLILNDGTSDVKSVPASSGVARLTYDATAHTYQMRVANGSNFASPNANIQWSTTAQKAPATWSGTVFGNTTSTPPFTVTADSNGYLTATATWGSANVVDSLGSYVNAASPSSPKFNVNAPGSIDVNVDWGSTSTSFPLGNAVSVGNNSTVYTPVTVSANGTIDGSATFPTGKSGTLALVDANNHVVAGPVQSALTGGSVTLPTYPVTGLGAYPATATYKYRITTPSTNVTSTSVSLSGTWPVTANLNAELRDPSGTVVASSYSTSSKPEYLHYTVPSGDPLKLGDYTLTVLSTDYYAGWTATAAHRQLADVTFNLKNSAGAVVATSRGSSGALSQEYLALPGTYPQNFTYELYNNSSFLAANATMTAKVPASGGTVGTTLTLKSYPSGTTVASDTTSAKPKSISANVAPGQYTLAVTANAPGNATLTGAYPGYANLETISYDANDHATVINDGTTTVTERLAPSGRVLERKVVDNGTGAQSEDTLYGYDDDGDSPAYTKDATTGVVTTYVDGPTGLILVDVGGTPTYPVMNAHGDIVGNFNAAGAYTANPIADEFGVGTTPSSRLGWLGGKQRYTADTKLGVIRMGVRLYEPRLGRFLETDPIEGGSANAYDYANADPINNFDLAGTCVEDACVVEGGAAIYVAGALAIGAAGWLASSHRGSYHITVHLPHLHNPFAHHASRSYGGWVDGLPRVRSKGGRPRWKSGKGNKTRIWEWDPSHGGEVEGYDRNGNHVGVYDPETGEKIKDPVPGRTIEP